MSAADSETVETNRLPWHRGLWAPMAQALAEERVAHGILVCGAVGVGKRRFAQRLVESLLCIDPDDNSDACGQCTRCRQHRAGTHPDISRLVPEEAGRQIKVEQVRAFSHRLQLTSQYDSGRVGWIDPAERLSISGANSLLKTLEEPPAGCHIVLLSDRVSALMATIRSRCQLWRVPSAEPSTGHDWLAAQGADNQLIDDDLARAPLTALARSTSDHQERLSQWDNDLARLLARKANPVNVAERASKEDAALWIDWLYRRAQYLLQASLASSGAAEQAPSSVEAQLQRAAHGLGAGVLEPWCRHVVRASRLQQSNADWRLVIESLLIDLSQRIANRPTR